MLSDLPDCVEYLLQAVGDLFASALAGLVGGLVYYTAFLLFGLTPTEKGAVMRLLHRSSVA